MGLEWFIFRTGPLTVGAGQGGIFARTRHPMAVIDQEPRVHRLSGLRIADAALMPTVVSGKTNAARS